MTHDVDALVKQAVVYVPFNQFKDGPLVRSLATALQSEHEARVKAEGREENAERIITDACQERGDWKSRATAAEAQLASAREALGKAETRFALIAAATTGSVSDAISGWSDEAREALRSLPAAAAGGEAPESNRCRDGHNFITVSGSPNRICRRCAVQEPPSDDAPSPQNIGQGLSEKGQNVSESAEDRAEQFIQAAIDRAPEPLRRLGEWLAFKLDDDDWKTADRLITGAAVSMTAALTAQEKTDV